MPDGDLCPECLSAYTVEVAPDGSMMCAACGHRFDAPEGGGANA